MHLVNDATESRNRTHPSTYLIMW